MKATEKLVELFNSHKVSSNMIKRDLAEEIIILRDEKKKDIEYEDTDETIRMRAEGRMSRAISTTSLS